MEPTVSQPQILPERLTGPRLTLRPLRADEATAWRDLLEVSLDHLRPWMAWAAEGARTVETWQEFSLANERKRLAGGDAIYAMELTETGELVGGCGLHRRGPANTLDIGYWIGAPFVRRGLTAEAVGVLAEAGLAQNGIDSIRITHDAENKASGRVAAAAGFGFSHQFVDEADGRLSWMWRNVDLPGLTIRPEAPGDYEAIAKVVAEAFGSTAEADLVEAIRRSPEYRPELALVAEVEGQIVGHTMISGCKIRPTQQDGAGTDQPGARSSVGEAVMLSPLAVSPDFQRHGLGASLVRAALDRADEAGEPIVILEGNPAYYSRFGFVPAYEYGLTIHLPDWAPVEAGQVVFLSQYKALSEPDRAALRGEVVYPPAFDGV